MQLTHRELLKGTKVWYGYSNYKQVYGPFIVQRQFADHRGSHVILKAGDEERSVMLADDDDFGDLTFYSQHPQGQPDG